MTTTNTHRITHTRSHARDKCFTTWTNRVAGDGAEIWPSDAARKHAAACTEQHGPLEPAVSVANFVALNPPAWATRIAEHADGDVSYEREGTVEVPTDRRGQSHRLRLSLTIGINNPDLDLPNLEVWGQDDEPVIFVEQCSLTADGARQMIAALTELIEAYDAALKVQR